MKSYKQVSSTGTPEDLVTMAIAELNELAEELREWADSMEGTNLASGDKFDSITEAADKLESISSPAPDDWPCSEARVPYTEDLPRRKRRSPSRQIRFTNAMGKIEAVIEFYSSLDEDHSDLISQLEEITGELNDVEIPGAWG